MQDLETMVSIRECTCPGGPNECYGNFNCQEIHHWFIGCPIYAQRSNKETSVVNTKVNTEAYITASVIDDDEVVIKLHNLGVDSDGDGIEDIEILVNVYNDTKTLEVSIENRAAIPRILCVYRYD